MASRFGRNDARNALFSNYDAPSPSQSHKDRRSPAPTSNRTASPYNGYGVGGGGYGVGTDTYVPQGGAPAFEAYGGMRSATPNKKGQYSDAVLSEMEAQNEDQASEMGKKVRMLKDLSIAIGTEIRDSTAFAEKMNDQFEGAGNRLRGTMNRMLRMAERTGVGWRIWLGFFFFVFLLFAYVWLF